MSKEREQHPCLAEDRKPSKILSKEIPKKYKIERNLNMCQSCGLSPSAKKLKTRDKLTVRLCNVCFDEYRTE